MAAPKSPEDFAKMFLESARQMERYSNKIDASWEEIAKHVDKVSMHFDKGVLGATTKALGLQGTFKALGSTIRDAFLGKTDFVDALAERTKNYGMKLLELDKSGVSKRSKEYRDLKAQGVASKAMLEAHQRLATEISSRTEVALAAFVPVLVAGLREAVHYSHAVSKDMTDAAANFTDRYSLLKQTAQVQAATGASIEHIAKGSGALVKYGFDLRDNFKDTLGIVVKMEAGLGVSAESSAELAATARNIKSNFAQVADVVARVKADTALSAQQAVQFANELNRAIALLKPGSGGAAAGVIEYIERLEGAMQGIGVQAGAIKDMLIGFTQEKGMMGAATLGATPDFISDTKRTKEVAERFVDYVDKQLAGTSGYQRMVTIQLLAQQFGTTADVVGNARRMMEDYNTQLKSGTNLQKEWSNQTSLIGDSFHRIINSGKGVLHQVLLPIVGIFARLMKVAADLVEWVTKSRLAVLTAGTVFYATGLLAGAAMWRLSRALWAAAASALAYEATLKSGSATKGILSAFGAGGMGSLVMSVVRAAGPALLVALAGAVGYAIGSAIDKYWKHFGFDLGQKIADALKPKSILMGENRALFNNGFGRAQFERDVTAAIARGATQAEVRSLILKEGSLWLRNLDQRDKAALNAQAEGVIDIVGKQMTRQRLLIANTGLAATQDENTKQQREAIQRFRELVENSDLLNDLIKRTEQKKEAQAEAVRRENQDQRQHDNLRNATRGASIDALRSFGGLAGMGGF